MLHYNDLMSHRSNQLVPELSVTDCKKSLDFYTRILGFSVAYQREEEGFAFLTLGEAQLMIDEIGVGRTWHTSEYEYPFGRGINFQIHVPDVDAIYKHLHENNISIFLEMEEKWYRKDDKESGSKQFLVQDPDGYLLRFSEDLGERAI